MSLLNKKGQLLISPGDLIDKMLILSLKKEQIVDTEGVIADEIDRLTQLLTLLNDEKLCSDELTLFQHVAKLSHINIKLWQFHNKVILDSKPDQQSFTVKQIQITNKERIAVKNKINTLYDYPAEKKLYESPTS